MKLKMCGLFREQDIACVNGICPDYIGFVFAPSPRQVSPRLARHLKSLLNPRIQAVGVFVEWDYALIAELVDSRVIDVVQLHDTLCEGASCLREHFLAREECLRELRQCVRAPIIKAVAASSVEAIVMEAESQADFLLLDNGRGGSGECFCWEYMRQAREAGFHREFFLAGGISAKNLAQALSYRPYGIDLSKGLESKGVKDCAKMREIARLLAESKLTKS